jgi:hypothetical protein
VLCKDATKIKGTTLLYINGQGHLLRWCSEKLQTLKGKDPQDFDFEDEEFEDEEEDEGESSCSHDSGFAWLGKEHEVEEERRKQMGKGGGTSQKDDLEGFDEDDLDLSQTASTISQESLGGGELVWMKRCWMWRMHWKERRR